jgi:polyether ionophore transport system permease protein
MTARRAKRQVVWLRNVFLKTLWDCRVPILGWGVGLGALAPIIFAGVPIILSSPVGRDEILALTRNPVVRLFAEPVDVLSPGGYATWRLSMLLPMLAIWALLAVSRATRGEEESGAFDLLLSVSGSRLRVIVEKLAAITTALVLAGALLAVLTLVGARATHVELEPRRALLFGLNTTLFALVFGALALVVSQFTRERRPAAGATGILLGLSFALASAGRVVPDGAWLGWLSPLYYFELNKPLVTGYDVNVGGLALMAALAVVLTGIGLVLFVRRDIGAPYVLPERFLPQRRPPRMLPMQSWSLQSLMTRNARRVAGAAFWWGVGLGTYSLLLTVLLRLVQQNLSDLLADLGRNNPTYAEFIDRFTRGGDIATNMVFLNAVFSLLVVVIAAFAVSLANRWATDEEEGRLDLILATPKPRYLVMLTPFAAGAVGLTIATGCIFVGCALASAAVGMELNISRVAGAAFGMVPVGLVVASIGFLLGGWLRVRAMTGILIALVLASFALTLLAPLFHWPWALLQLSIFEHYGAPLVDGLNVGRVLGQIGVATATFAAAVVRFERKDLTR